MAGQVPTIPPGFHALNAYLTVRGAAEAMAFYERAFGAQEIFRLVDDQGRVGHAEVRIGDTILMLAEEHPEFGIFGPRKFGGSPVRLHLYVEDVDAVYARAVAAGARAVSPLANQFYGDRSGRLEDPFGHCWLLASHIEDVSSEEMQRRYAALLAQASPSS